jgi:amino acid transporter
MASTEGGAPSMHHEGTITSLDVSERADVEKLKGGSLGLLQVLFLCVTGSAPLAVFMFNFPFSVGAGNEKGTPAGFLFATVVLTIFSVGYVQMAKKLRAAGGMFTYVSHGLGRPWGLMSGLSLAAAYTLFGASLIGGFAAFAQNKLAENGHSVPWIWIALAGTVGIMLLGYFDIKISAQILGVALLCELAIILIFTIGVFIQGGNDGISAAPVNPINGFKGVAFGLGIFIAFWSWVGFEAAPNYAEESKNPLRTIPIAVYASCIGVGVLYTLASWASVTAYGTHNEAFDALSAGSTTVFGGKLGVDYLNFNVVPAQQLIGNWLGTAMSWFIITGAFACASALNNAGLRYTYSLGREGLLPKVLGRTHRTHRTPHMAVLFQGAICAAICLGFWFVNHLPLDVYYWIAVQGVIWILLVQALTSLSVWVYFRREHPTEQHWWKTILAPWIGFIAQIVVLYLCYNQLTALGAGTAIYVEKLFTIGPWSLGVFNWHFKLEMNWLGIIGIVVPVAGFLYAYYLRAADRARYEVAGRFINEGTL